MTAAAVPAAVPVAGRSKARHERSHRFRDIVVMTRRNLAHIAREPMQLSDVTIQPILFTVLFVSIFSGAVPIPGGGSYTDFAIGGLLVLNLTTSAVGTAVGLSNDLSTGAIDRFRTLPMARNAVLFGRSISDLLAATLCSVLVLLTGLVVGWSADSSLLSVLAGLGVALLFAYGMSWAMACLGLVSKGSESAQALAFLLVFPLAFVSNAFVPTGGMPDWLQTLADWNPVSAVAAACRDLFGNPNPSAGVDAWPMQHPVLAAVLWSVLILAVFVPLAAVLYRRRTTE